MSAKTNENNQKITLTAGTKELTFDVSRDDYNKLINSSGPNNKIGPMHNFLVSTVTVEDKPALLELLGSTPGAEVALCSALVEEYAPDLDVVAKKRKA